MATRPRVDHMRLPEPAREPGTEVLSSELPRRADGKPTLLRIEQAAAELGVGRRMIYRLIGGGELPIVKLGSRTLIPFVALNALVERRQVYR